MIQNLIVSRKKRLPVPAALMLGIFLLLGSVHAARAQQPAQSSPSSGAVQHAQQNTDAEVQSGGQTEPADEKDEYRLSASTQWLAAKLHIPPRMAALLFEFINFAVLFGAIGVALRKVLPGMFRSRGEKLEGQLTEARAATLDANHRLDVVETRLSRLDEEIVGLRGRAEGEMKAEEERFRASLEQEKERIVENAEQEIAAAGAAARRELKRLAADLAVAKAERNLNMTPELDQSLVTEFAQMLGSKNGSNN